MSDHIHIYSHSGLDRVSERRSDKAWLEEIRRAPESRYIVLQEARPLVRLNSNGRGDLVFLDHAAVEQLRLTGHTEPVLLGLDNGGRAHFAADVVPDTDLADRGEPVDLRALGYNAVLRPHEMAYAAQAKSLIDWHARHTFCSSCGAPDVSVKGGYMRHCGACGREHFPRVDPVVIMLVHRGGRCILGRSPRFVANMYSALAGFIEAGESVEEAVRREVKEETGIDVGRVRYHSSQPWPFPSSLMIGCLCEALSETITIDENELTDARWFTRKEAAQILQHGHPEEITAPMPFAIAHHLLRAFIEGGEG